MALDLTIDKRIEGTKPRKRTLGDPGTFPSSLLGGSGGSGGSGGFAAAKWNRLTMDFAAQSRSADQDLQGDNKPMRGRARNLALNSGFVRKFLAMVVQNVVSPKGILLQARVKGVNGADTAESKRINQRIEEEWLRWGRVGRCTADGRFSWVEMQQLAIKAWARDGEALTKKAYSKDLKQYNGVGFALQPLDADQLDDSLLQSIGNGAEIRMGVEVDQYRRPLAYHLWDEHPQDTISRSRQRRRIPASEIIHTAMWERPGQTRGYTQLCAAMLAMNQYGRYEEAVVVAARASAAKFGTIETAWPEGYAPDEEDESGSGTNGDGTEYMSGDTGEVMKLAVGESFKFTDPRFPTNTHKDFTQTMIRNIATGLLVSYPSLANDLEGVNFSSIRAGLLEERDCWRIIQRWFIDHFCQPVFDAWLPMALLTVLSDITLSQAQREQVEWRPRGWPWVDPEKDAAATILRLGNGMDTYANALAEQGMDFEAVMDERAREQKYIEDLQERFQLKYPVVLSTDLAGDAGGKGMAPGDEDGGAGEDAKPAAKK